MKIISCYIEGFGRLKNKSFSFSEGLNRIVGDNGSGKTTLSVFIKAMLYGLSDTKKTDLSENDRRHYLPWDGSACGGSLEFSVGKKRYRAERSFGQKASLDSFILYDLATGKTSDDYSEALGKEIFGIDADGFERTVFLSERNLTEAGNNRTVSARLGYPMGFEGDVEGMDRALKILDDERKRYQKKGGAGEIANVSARIYQCESRLSELDALETRLKDEEKRIAQMTEELSRVEGSIKKTDGQRELAKLHRAGEREKKGLGGSETEELLINTEGTEKKRGIAQTLLAMGILLTLSGGILGLLYDALISVSAIGIALIAYALIKIKRIGKEKEKAEEQLNIKRSDAEERITALRRDIAVAEVTVRSLLSALEEKPALIVERDELLSLLKEGQDRLKIILLTTEMLKEASDSISSKYLGKTKESFEKYAELILGESDARYQMDTSFGVSRLEAGRARSAESYSKGTRELYYLGARLALVDSLYPDECPPLILDDPFLSFDDKKTEAALKLLGRLSADRQIIYFTASKSRS